jgi:exoribonuclease-2
VLEKSFKTGVFNTHSGFKTEKLKDVIALVNSEYSDPVHTEESLSTLEGFAALRRELTANDSTYIDNRIRKLQAYSEVGNAPKPHYAMGLDVYATWTSPIRKYGDMVNHRLLKDHILNQEPTQIPDDKLGEELAIHRRHHKIAERTVGDWLYARTLSGAPKDQTVFTAEIFDINRAGIRARLIDNGATVFIPNSLILNDKKRLEANSEEGKIYIDKEVIYKLGDQFKVILHEVNMENRSLVAKPVEAHWSSISNE